MEDYKPLKPTPLGEEGCQLADSETPRKRMQPARHKLNHSPNQPAANFRE